MNPFLDDTTKHDAIKARALQDLRASIRPGEELTDWALRNRAGVALLEAADAIEPGMRKTEHQKLLREIIRSMVEGKTNAND